MTRTYEPNRDILAQVQNQFGTTVVSQYDYINDAIRRKDTLTTSGTAFDAVPTPVVTPGDTDYTTNELNQYPHITAPSGVIGLDYDDDGNLTNDGTLEYVYDAENRMITATPLYPVDGSKKLEAGYDYQGRRVSKTVSTYIAGIWTVESTKTFTYDGWNVIRETTTGSSTSTEGYVWGLDLSGSLQGAGGIGGLLLRNTASGNYVYMYDANGNVGQLVNTTDGTLAAHYEYDPFGNTLVADGPEAWNNSFRYSTKPYDGETGWLYYGKRYYSPKLGRWPTRDPIGEAGGVNLYGFVGNTPINGIDFHGLHAQIQNGATIPIVIIGSETLKWVIKDKHGCCKKGQEEEIPGILIVLVKGGTAISGGSHIEDPDAIIDIDGTPYKTGANSRVPFHGVHVCVTGGPPLTDLFEFTPLDPVVHWWRDEDIGKNKGKFWEEATLFDRADNGIAYLEMRQREMEACPSENEAILTRIKKLIQSIHDAKDVLSNIYGLK